MNTAFSKIRMKMNSFKLVDYLNAEHLRIFQSLFHHSNSAGDAIILESVIKYMKEFQNTSGYFFSFNITDFSDKKDRTKPHPELSSIFIDARLEYSIDPTTVIEKLLNIRVSEETKKAVSEYSSFVPLLGDEFPASCLECNGELRNSGYRVLYGGAGHVSVCEDCGIIYMLLDPDY